MTRRQDIVVPYELVLKEKNTENKEITQINNLQLLLLKSVATAVSHFKKISANESTKKSFIELTILSWQKLG